MNVFIIHCDEDTAFVEQLSEKLRQKGVKIWHHKDESQDDDNVLDRVTRDSDDAEFVIPVISRHFSSATWTSHELSAWMIKEALSHKPILLPILLEECDVPSFLAHYTYFDFRDAFDVPMDMLLAVITEPNRRIHEECDDRISTLDQINAHQLARIRGAFVRGKLTLFCGAGVSMSAGIPGWKVFLRFLLSDFFDQNRTSRTPDKNRPSRLAQIYQEYFDLSPIIVAQYLKNALGKDFQHTVRDALYTNDPTSSPLIDSICDICRPQRERQALNAIVNFNFDDLIEQNLDRNKIKYRAIFSEGQRPSLSELPIYHVHGFLPRQGTLDSAAEIVFSEDTYHSKFIDPFSWSNLIQLNQLQQNTCLFVGLGMTDPNLRRLLDVAMRKNPEKKLNHFIFRKRYDTSDLARHMSKLERLDDSDKHACRLVRMAEILEERDCNNLGLNVIWVDKFEEIPPFFCKINGN